MVFLSIASMGDGLPWATGGGLFAVLGFSSVFFPAGKGGKGVRLLFNIPKKGWTPAVASGSIPFFC